MPDLQRKAKMPVIHATIIGKKIPFCPQTWQLA